MKLANLSLLVCINAAGVDPKNTSIFEAITQHIQEQRDAAKATRTYVYYGEGTASSSMAEHLKANLPVLCAEVPDLSSTLNNAKETVWSKVQSAARQSDEKTMVVLITTANHCSSFPGYYGTMMAFKNARELNPQQALKKGDMVFVSHANSVGSMKILTPTPVAASATA